MEVARQTEGRGPSQYRRAQVEAVTLTLTLTPLPGPMWAKHTNVDSKVRLASTAGGRPGLSFTGTYVAGTFDLLSCHP